MRFARELGNDVALLDDYLDGDCTIRIRKREDFPKPCGLSKDQNGP